MQFKEGEFSFGHSFTERLSLNSVLLLKPQNRDSFWEQLGFARVRFSCHLNYKQISLNLCKYKKNQGSETLKRKTEILKFQDEYANQLNPNRGFLILPFAILSTKNFSVVLDAMNVQEKHLKASGRLLWLLHILSGVP